MKHGEWECARKTMNEAGDVKKLLDLLDDRYFGGRHALPWMFVPASVQIHDKSNRKPQDMLVRRVDAECVGDFKAATGESYVSQEACVQESEIRAIMAIGKSRDLKDLARLKMRQLLLSMNMGAECAIEEYDTIREAEMREGIEKDTRARHSPRTLNTADHQGD